ncbi:MAG: translation initiation factor IF-2 [Bacteroidales bacterium]
MSNIKLNKIVRELNVGISTAVEFLQQKGYQVEANPNARIGETEYELLKKEFSTDKNMKEESERISQERHSKDKNKASVSIEEPESSVIITEVAEDIRPKIKEVGRINLEDINKKMQKPEKVAKKEVVSKTPKAAQLAEEAPKSVKTNATKAETETIEVKSESVKEEQKANIEVNNTEEESGNVFRINAPKVEQQIKQVGFIDLSSINDRTRPQKKSKEEKKKEREDKRKPNHAPGKPTGDRPVLKLRDKDGKESNDAEKKKRKRIDKEKIDVNKAAPKAGGANANNNNNNNNQHKDRHARKPLKKPVLRSEVSDEDVQKQIKETLARLTAKPSNKGAKFRKEKRQAIQDRQQERLEQEEAESKVLKITEFVTANDLANMMNVPVIQVISTCMSLGMMVSINQRLDAETINIVAEEFGYTTEYVSAEVVEAISVEEDKEEDMISRPPIVTVMGHVDHGKTSLLDYIRSANVIAGEAGGITQHIGAYHVTMEDGRMITFLDTPGHEAFTAMRARGAQVTDIAIIIVAADDSVMPQTIEAINHASAAGVPIVFAINKIDKPGANPDKIREALSAMNYLVEEWGGKYQSQEISAKKGIGIEDLMEKVLLEAEMLDLKANPNKRAVGSIIESSLDKGRGYVATILVQSGTLRIGDVVLAGTNHGRVKAMFNERGQRVKEAGPSEPVLILGLNGAPQAGDAFNVMETEQEAREISNKREQLQREQGLRTQKLLTLEDIGRRIAIGNFQELNVIVKGDVDGSVEALSDSLIKLSTEEIQINVIHKAVGQISDSDVVLAAASNAIIVGFQVRPSVSARRLAEKEGVDIRMYSIIYTAIEELKDAMSGMLSPEIKEEITATIEIREVFKITKVGTVAGCMVKEGKVKRGNKARLIRDGIVVYTGELASLKRFKDDVKEVNFGYECGLNLVNYNDIKVGDIVETYEEVEVQRTL